MTKEELIIKNTELEQELKMTKEELREIAKKSIEFTTIFTLFKITSKYCTFFGHFLLFCRFFIGD